MDETDLRREIATTKLVRSALVAGMIDPEDVTVYVDPDSVDVDDDDAIAATVHDVLRQRPYLNRPATGTVDQGPRGNAPRSITRADLQHMSPEQIHAARLAGDLDAILEGYSRGSYFTP